MANAAKTKIANTWAVLRRRSVECETAWGGHAVNFIAVDFWSEGDTVAVSMYLNLDSVSRQQVEGSASGGIQLDDSVVEMIKKGRG